MVTIDQLAYCGTNCTTKQSEVNVIKPSPGEDDLRIDHHKDVIDEMLNGSDFACALLGASTLDLALEELLEKHFEHSDQALREKIFRRPGAPLSTFAHKIYLAQALGLVSKQLAASLDEVRRVRNEFAHRAERVSFSDPIVLKHCLKLDTSAEISEPRLRYIHAVMSAIKAIANSTIKALRKQMLQAEKEYEQKLSAIERKRDRELARIDRAHDMYSRVSRGEYLSKSERDWLRRLEKELKLGSQP